MSLLSPEKDLAAREIDAHVSDGALMRAGFHPDFRMYALRDGALAQVTLGEWIGRIEKGARERTTPRPEVRHA